MRRRDVLKAAAGTLALPAFASHASAQSNPFEPLGRVAVADAKEAVVDEAGTTAYLAVTDGFATVDISDPEEPAVLAERRGLLDDRESGPLDEIWDVKVSGDRLVVASPANPRRGDVLHGFALYDVGDPANPERVAFYETDHSIHNCFFDGEFAYLAANDRGDNPFTIIDVSDDDPEEVGRWSIVDHDEGWSDVDPWLRWVHDLWVQDGVAYLANWDAGTWLVDVSDPENPAYISDFGARPVDELAEIPSDEVQSEVLGLPGNDHYVMPNEDGTLLGVGKEAWVTEAPGADRPGDIELWDISDPESPERRATIEAPETDDGTYSVGPVVGYGTGVYACHECGGTRNQSGTWTTAHNFDLIGDRLFSSWYQGGVKIHDVSDPSNPEELAWWRSPDEASFWTAELATDDVFVASSMGQHGNGMGGLYTFPNRAGEQENPPSLDSSETDAGTEEPMEGPGTTEATESESDAGGAPAATGGQPGFGALAALLGAGIGAWRYLVDE